MTALQMLEHKAHAHDGTTGRWLTVSPAREVRVHWGFTDGTTDYEPFGKIDERGVWESACKAAGVLSSRLVEDDGRLPVDVTYPGEDGPLTEREWLCGLDSPGAWRWVPAEMFEAFEAIVEDWER